MIDKKELAFELNITERHVERLVKEGLIPPGTPVKFDKVIKKVWPDSAIAEAHIARRQRAIEWEYLRAAQELGRSTRPPARHKRPPQSGR